MNGTNSLLRFNPPGSSPGQAPSRPLGSLPNGLWRLIAVATSLVLAPTVFAQGTPSRRVPGYDGTSPAPDNTGFLHARGTPTPGHLRSQFTLAADLAFTEFELVDPYSDRLARAVSLRSRLHAVGQLGLGQRAAVSLHLPVILYQQGDAYAGRPELPSLALMDPQLRARYRLVGRVPQGVGERADGPGLALELGTQLPAGHKDGFAGAEGVRLEASAIADFQLLGAAIAAHLGFLQRFRPAWGKAQAMSYGLALRIPWGSWPALSWLVEANGQTSFTGKAESPLQGLLGAQVVVDEWTVQLAGGVGLLGRVASPDGVIQLAVRYSPARTDTDGDGIADDEDTCPFLPEDRDGFEDEDGCDDPDNDNDLVPDADDLCPNEEALEGQDEDEDGCTDRPEPAQ